MRQQISPAKRLANQRNAQKSTGPRTVEGKKKSSQNALTHGLFCQEVVLMTEDKSLFNVLRHSLIEDLKPQRVLELSFVDEIARTQWKLRRLRLAEAMRHESYFDKFYEDMEKKCHTEAAKEKVRAVKKDVAEGAYAAPMTMVLLIEENEKGLERFSRYEQRLNNTIHKCLRELRLIRKDQEQINALPESPFLTPSPLEGEGGGEGGAREVEQVKKEEENAEVDSAEQSQPDSHTSPSPQPSPSKGEGENEPTALPTSDRCTSSIDETPATSLTS
jgi:hypothetical protein